MPTEIGQKVFLVDDSSMVRERLAAFISDLPNVEVIGQAERAAEAIRRIRDLKPDVVVLDISIPGGSGLQVLQAVKKHNPPPLVIMLTNFAHEQYRRRCQQLGADYFFDKSSEFEKVMEVLQELATGSLSQKISQAGV
jgi:DNA-binding NarL/FixJ family response regulator